MNKIKKITSYELFLPIMCFILVLLINVIKTPTFFEVSIKNGVFYGYIIDVINRASELVILAVGMTLVVASSGGTDISVGAVMSVAAALCCYILAGGQQTINAYQNPYVLGILLALVVGVVCGCFNGFLVAKMKIQPMVATLILFTAGRGIAQLITKGQITYIRVENYKLLGANIPGIPLPTTIFVVVIVVLITNIVLKKTALGLYIQSVGINAKASRLVGLKSSRIIFLTYVFCGLCAGIAGLMASSRIYSADANNIGLNMELDAILAVALGGNSLSGGKFTLLGSVIGAYTIQALTTTLYAMSVSADQLPVYKAIVVVIIVSLQSKEFKKIVRGLKDKKADGRKEEQVA
ncbi:ABC transporter permease [Candidatus Galacturonibacter soehngenii]|uniref:ABC transporter permease n=1 Tax=Candidatus Galacturonatibacter soehngenii TaxID=2307010 RepID=A0A7V7QNS9_9FIRM|nr:ABC transporter permease [Candidatus Galacturonibacter soehngenii]KAB1440735.1 ABC transporter permease [Candidatus Galacturonibacter soehngenii]MBA4687497.1 ABC transporter permease [Candidatus Galacturonibacter soehngenii]